MRQPERDTLTPLFPAGEYAVVDPIQFFPEADWEDLIYDRLRNNSFAYIMQEGYCVFVWVTNRGDGTFPIYRDGVFLGSGTTANCVLCISPTAILSKELLKGAGSYFTSKDTVPKTHRSGDAQHGLYEVVTSGLLPESF